MSKVTEKDIVEFLKNNEEFKSDPKILDQIRQNKINDLERDALRVLEYIEDSTITIANGFQNTTDHTDIENLDVVCMYQQHEINLLKDEIKQLKNSLVKNQVEQPKNSLKKLKKQTPMEEQSVCSTSRTSDTNTGEGLGGFSSSDWRGDQAPGYPVGISKGYLDAHGHDAVMQGIQWQESR